FPVSPDQTMGFIEAVGLLGPVSMADIRASAIAMLAIAKDREDEFEALFRSHFYGLTIAPTVAGEDDHELQIQEPGTDTREVDVEDDDEEPGDLASGFEVLSQRGFAKSDNLVSLSEFARKAPGALPKRLSYRFANAKRGRRINMRELLKAASKTDGDAIHLPWLDRKVRQRKILLLIDVSGSMRDLSDSYLRFAHVLSQSASIFECFTIGTRLTRISTSLKPRERNTALTRVSQAVSDFDGGTRLGDALGAFLSIPRYSGYARGALVLVLSDGLERGDPTALVDAVKRLSRLSWQLHWLTPLASQEDFEPSTEALSMILPWLDDLAGGGSADEVCAHVLNMARAA
ncbi:MAG: VWA domain-containing protein, partial [Pseudomonadota bacterium]